MLLSNFGRTRRRNFVVFTIILLAATYTAVQFFRRGYDASEFHLPSAFNLASSSLLQPNSASQRFLFQAGSWGQSSSSSALTLYGSAPGFEAALPSCSIADLVHDPLVQEYGQNNIRLSRTYEGTGARVRKVLKKALRGQPIKIAVVGGSVSAVSKRCRSSRPRP